MAIIKDTASQWKTLVSISSFTEMYPFNINGKFSTSIKFIYHEIRLKNTIYIFSNRKFL